MKMNAKLHIAPKCTNCPCDLILGLDLLRKVGIILNYKECAMPWENSVTHFKSASTLSALDPAEIMSIDLDTPPIVHEYENDYDHNVYFNECREKDWKKAARNSTHLTPLQR